MTARQADMGLYRKFHVERVDGRDKPGGDRENADYFVLDMANDPHAVAAIYAYAKSCSKEYPQLAGDILDRIEEHWSD